MAVMAQLSRGHQHRVKVWPNMDKRITRSLITCSGLREAEGGVRDVAVNVGDEEKMVIDTLKENLAVSLQQEDANTAINVTLLMTCWR